MATLHVREVGSYIREQRRGAQISLRQLAKLAGVSNPYLSQVERGLRKPSAEILQQIAKGLRISAEALYVQAGILEERGAGSDVPAALLADPFVTERQKNVLLEIYESFRRENAAAGVLPEGDQRAVEPATSEPGTSELSVDGPSAAEPQPARAGRRTGDTAARTKRATGRPATKRAATAKSGSGRRTRSEQATSRPSRPPAQPGSGDEPTG